MWNCNDVVKIQYTRGYTFFVEFDDGKKGEIKLDEFLQIGPVFRALRDKRFFRNAKIEGGTISWPNGADIAPETLYEKLDKTPKQNAFPYRGQRRRRA